MMDWAAKEAEKIVLRFWKDIETHWFGRKMPIAKLEANIARALRRADKLTAEEIALVRESVAFVWREAERARDKYWAGEYTRGYNAGVRHAALADSPVSGPGGSAGTRKRIKSF